MWRYTAYLEWYGPTVNDQLYTFLSALARMMAQAGKRRAVIQGEDFTLIMETEFRWKSLVTFGGVEFLVRIERGSNPDIRARCLVDTTLSSDAFLAGGGWTTTPPPLFPVMN